ncbi:FGGY family carbohydrate kinase [Fulvimarina sp. MAC3]|uniref:FGGY family carbohydrate kinase n=1 Tax=Fulvimarina sp. MAC3 TaxID=3148887 RepID=UPI0031FDA5C1
MADRQIGIDAGGTLTKVAMFDSDGREPGSEPHPNTTLLPAPGRTERDPDAMWDATCRAIRTVIEVSGTRPHDVAALSTRFVSGNSRRSRHTSRQARQTGLFVRPIRMSAALPGREPYHWTTAHQASTPREEAFA